MPPEITTVSPCLRLAEQPGMGAELLTFPAPLELMAEGDGGGGTFKGFGTVFGNIIDSWIPTTFQKGAFADSIRDDFDRIVILQQHRPTMVLGRPTLLEETVIGLAVEGMISDTAIGRDALTLMRDSVLTEMSVGFDPITWEMDEEADLRTITKATLKEISIAVFALDSKARITEVNSAAAVAYCEANGWPVPCELQARKTLNVFFSDLGRIFGGNYPEFPDRETLSDDDRVTLSEAVGFFTQAAVDSVLDESDETGGDNTDDDVAPFDPDVELLAAEYMLAELDLETVNPVGVST